MSLQVIAGFQAVMASKGIYRGDVDGKFGPITFAASQQYFCLKGDVPPWMSFAGQELGVSEIYGSRHNPRIIHYHSYTGLGAQTDETPWCASFVNCCLLEGAGIKGTASASAGSFKTYGKPVDPKTYGAIGLHKTNTGSLRHVFFCAGFWDGHIFCIGGNQSNKVSVVANPIKLITESRFPK
jgi:uncharacterized protein (TIGR02594 family)